LCCNKGFSFCNLFIILFNEFIFIKSLSENLKFNISNLFRMSGLRKPSVAGAAFEHPQWG
ncbi:MAG: hypothetical protein II835_03610, partial [Fibrobacter sp.]|nr:hypothetical protein [Fibrobacter sp.]